MLSFKQLFELRSESGGGGGDERPEASTFHSARKEGDTYHILASHGIASDDAPVHGDATHLIARHPDGKTFSSLEVRKKGHTVMSALMDSDAREEHDVPRGRIVF